MCVSLKNDKKDVINKENNNMLIIIKNNMPIMVICMDLMQQFFFLRAYLLLAFSQLNNNNKKNRITIIERVKRIIKERENFEEKFQTTMFCLGELLATIFLLS